MAVTLGLDSPEDLFWGLSDMEEKSTQMTLTVSHASDTQRPRMPRHTNLPVIPIPRPPFYSSAHPQLTQSQPPKSSDNKDHRLHCQTTLLHPLNTLHPLLAVEAWLPEDTADSEMVAIPLPHSDTTGHRVEMEATSKTVIVTPFT